MKRYLLFSGRCYYHCGGWDDFVDSFDTIEEAKQSKVTNDKHEWIQIVDTQTMEIIYL